VAGRCAYGSGGQGWGGGQARPAGPGAQGEPGGDHGAPGEDRGGPVSEGSAEASAHHNVPGWRRRVLGGWSGEVAHREQGSNIAESGSYATQRTQHARTPPLPQPEPTTATRNGPARGRLSSARPGSLKPACSRPRAASVGAAAGRRVPAPVSEVGLLIRGTEPTTEPAGGSWDCSDRHPEPGPPCTTTAGLPSGLPHTAQWINCPSPTSTIPCAYGPISE